MAKNYKIGELNESAIYSVSLIDNWDGHAESKIMTGAELKSFTNAAAHLYDIHATEIKEDAAADVEKEEKKMQEENTMTKAERIFRDTYTECRIIVKNYGYETYSRLSNLVMKDTELGCTRTFNAIAKLIERERRSIVLHRKLNAINDERAEMLTNALNMVENTLKKEIEIQREIERS